MFRPYQVLEHNEATRMAKAKPQIKRVYDPPSDKDGRRVLVDRLWPRGLAKANAGVDRWLKEVAPSHELRKRFHGAPGQWAQFTKAYKTELVQGPAADALEELRGLIKKGPVTLLFAASDLTHNNAIALRDILARP